MLTYGEEVWALIENLIDDECMDFHFSHLFGESVDFSLSRTAGNRLKILKPKIKQSIAK